MSQALPQNIRFWSVSVPSSNGAQAGRGLRRGPSKGPGAVRWERRGGSGIREAPPRWERRLMASVPGDAIATGCWLGHLGPCNVRGCPWCARPIRAVGTGPQSVLRCGDRSSGLWQRHRPSGQEACRARQRTSLPLPWPHTGALRPAAFPEAVTVPSAWTLRVSCSIPLWSQGDRGAGWEVPPGRQGPNSKPTGQ